jgi:hypothetical protein
LGPAVGSRARSQPSRQHFRQDLNAAYSLNHDLGTEGIAGSIENSQSTPEGPRVPGFL